MTTIKPIQGITFIDMVSGDKHKIRVLDGTKVTYVSWVRLFKLHARGYKVLSHIDGTPAPAKTDDSYESRYEVDANVLQWIYGTLSDDLLPRVFEDESTPREALVRVKNIFNNNKEARTAALEQEFNALRLANMPLLEAYCQRLHELAGMLKDVDSSVTDRRLVIQLVRGLPTEYDTVASYINQTLPNFETARSMLELEVHRKSGRDETATALASPAASPADIWVDPPPKATSGPPHQSSNNNSSNSPASAQSAPAAPTAWSSPWTPPPCPYQTYQGWAQPWPQYAAPQQRPPSYHRGNSPRAQGQAYVMDTEPPQPTDLAHAFQALSIQQNVAPWYMDTWASSHLTSDPGMISAPFNTSNIRSIYVGNSNSIPVTGSGTSTIPTNTRTLHLHQVLHTPKIIKNLISVRQFTKDNNVSVEFHLFGFTVKDIPTGKMIFRSDSNAHNIYRILP
ncbi:hypothetical protein RND81_12G206700 [Saponaria officinalis]|uniref:Retrovirus-related Pol polyprotein from transposon TNT 1-94-like beta-barrel domain-containing protein n=1 Tax=Saponaria officinalis TaxID=3572 RepID=A0AAW1HDC5_SAPOF